jgi:CRP-like cAMP-binding protein
LGKGVMFGEIGVLYGTNRTAFCVALGKVITLRLEGGVFKKIFAKHVRTLNK